MISTCTVRTVHSKVIGNEMHVALGTVLSLQPFFVTNATEKEGALCLCKLCLNMRMLFAPLMKQ